MAEVIVNRHGRAFDVLLTVPNKKTAAGSLAWFQSLEEYKMS